MNVDEKAIRHALREMNAAQNSSVRAETEFWNILPAGVILLHHYSGEIGSPDAVYWDYQQRDGHSSYSICWGKEMEGKRVIIVEAPGPREEFLPRLEGTP